MADVFRRFTQTAPDTAVNTIFTVPTADIAATPPVPVSTFIIKTIILHNSAGSGNVVVKLFHNAGSGGPRSDSATQWSLCLCCWRCFKTSSRLNDS